MMTKKKTSYNTRDVFGRNLSYLLACLPQLEQIDAIDLYSRDWESGYTPLHVCLRLGYLQKAFQLHKRSINEMDQHHHHHHHHHHCSKDSVWDQTDREGLSPLELFCCENDYWKLKTIPTAILPERLPNTEEGLIRWTGRLENDRRSELSPHIHELRDLYTFHRGGREVYTFGSNINMQLATGDSDNRQKLFKLDEYQLDGEYRILPVRFRKNLMTRYHSILTTMENTIYTSGNGSRGRLGNGDPSTSSFKYQRLPLDGVTVRDVVTSDHHTLLLTTTNDVIAWGWNRYSQLGYALSVSNYKNADKSASENNCSSIPKRISHCPWKKTWSGEVQFIACSKVHSCLIDDNNYLYSWGLDLGQMGLTKNHSTDSDIIHMGFKGNIVESPFGVKLPSYLTNIKQLTCTDFATFILFETNQLCVLTSHKILRFTLPRSLSQQTSNGFDIFTPASLTKTTSVIKIKSSDAFGNNLCVLYENGAVGILQSKNEPSSIWLKFPNILPVAQYWIPYFEWNRCLDFDCGSKGQLILCTTGGDVYTCNGSTSSFEKKKSGKLITGRCISVSCDSLFASFAVIKDDFNAIPLHFPKNSLHSDFMNLSPLSKVHTGQRRKQDLELNGDPCQKFIFEYFSRSSNEEGNAQGMLIDSELDTAAEYRADDKLWRDMMSRWIKLKPLAYRDMYLHVPRLNINDAQVLEKTGSHDVEFVDGVTKTLVAKCHKAMLLARSPIFLKSLVQYGYVTWKNENTVKMELISNINSPVWIISVDTNSEKLTPSILKYAIHYMYTDEIIDFSGSQLYEYQGNLSKKQLEIAVIHFIKMLDMNITSFKNDTLISALKVLLEQAERFSKDTLIHPDTVINLLDGKKLYCYSFILASRCAYFECLFADEWSRSKNVKEMDMTHISQDAFMCVLKYIHGTPFDELLSHFQYQSPEEFIEFILGLIEITDELLLSEMKHYFQSVLVDFISSSTVIPLLVNAFYLKCEALALECCWYIYNNIAVLFKKQNFEIIDDHFNHELWYMLEEFIRMVKNQNGQQQTNFQTWYQDEKCNNWVNLFRSNVHKFNDRFMDPDDRFEVIFDLKKIPREKSNGKKTGNSDRRKSSASSNRKPSISQENLTNVRRPSLVSLKNGASSWKYNESAIDDNYGENSENGFTIVTKSRRKSSIIVEGPRRQSNSEAMPTNTNVAKFETVSSSISIVSSKKSLPGSLLEPGASPTQETFFPTLSNVLQPPGQFVSPVLSDGISSGCLSQDTPKPSFSNVKKISQKQRIKQLALEDEKRVKMEKKPAWGGATRKKSANTINSNVNKFPSLGESLQVAAATKKPINATVSMTSDGSSGTIPLYLNKAQSGNNQPVRSLKETMEEEQFAKWWSEESARVQDEMRQQEELEKRLLEQYGDHPSKKPSKPSKSNKQKKQHKPRDLPGKPLRNNKAKKTLD